MENETDGKEIENKTDGKVIENRTDWKNGNWWERDRK